MRHILLVLFLFAGTISFAQEKEPELTWPREIKEKEYTITLYQSQLESLEGNIMKGRMALSVKNEKEDIIFGALWFNARISTDLETRIAVLEAIEIPKVKFPDIKDESKLERLKTLIIEDLESMNLKMSLDRILAGIESIENENELGEKLKNDPPEIFFRKAPAVLVIIDGEPILENIEGSKLETVVNTPFLIIKDNKNYYIHGGNYWYKADELTSEKWNVTKSVPKDVEKASKKMIDNEQSPEVKEENSEIPDIIVTTKPSELIISDGELKYEPIDKTSLLFVSNSENDIILDINLQTHFLLLNGRWYNSKTLKDGEWEFIEPEKLPKEFATIPSNATIASVKVSVPGTSEAQEALYEQQMPQTAVVDRKTATTKVEYDGKPKFEKMEGTSVQYAANTESTVIKVDKTYYCVDEGIWFESSKAEGPWKVSDKRPDEVDEIPPSAPVYNVKYVYIYDSTPEVVYVGYTPGYCHSYVYGGVVVYGTGYYYRPWYGAYYYPRPVTYGFGVHYNPYTGWGFSVGVSYGW
ncbi:MAG: carbohydrate-binding family V/XII, partial [Draconibacterium sp.]|nr:carbohydrate-binding family V/XII [Draconibacterium sp.]